MINKDNVRVTVTLPKDLYNKIQKKCKEDYTSFTNYVIFLVLQDLRKS